jgi:hypothetical protein
MKNATEMEYQYITSIMDKKSIKSIEKDSTLINYIKTKNSNLSAALPCGPYEYKCPDENRHDLNDVTFMCKIPNDFDSSFTPFSSVSSCGKVRIFFYLDEVRPIWTKKEMKFFLTSSNGLLEFEIVDLELPNDENTFLYFNSSKFKSVFCVHTNGVYELNFPFLSNVDEFLKDYEENDEFESTIVHHLLSSEFTIYF